MKTSPGMFVRKHCTQINFATPLYVACRSEREMISLANHRALKFMSPIRQTNGIASGNDVFALCYWDKRAIPVFAITRDN